MYGDLAAKAPETGPWLARNLTLGVCGLG